MTRLDRVAATGTGLHRPVDGCSLAPPASYLAPALVRRPLGLAPWDTENISRYMHGNEVAFTPRCHHPNRSLALHGASAAVKALARTEGANNTRDTRSGNRLCEPGARTSPGAGQAPHRV